MASPESDTKLNHDLYPEEWRNDYKDIKLVQSIDKPDQLKAKKAENGSWINLDWPPLEESIKEAYKDYKDYPIDITESQKPVDAKWNNMPVTVIGVKYLFNGKEYAVVKGTSTLNSFIPKHEIAWNGSSGDHKVSTHPLSEAEKKLMAMTEDRNRWKARAEQFEKDLENLRGEMDVLERRVNELEGKKTSDAGEQTRPDTPLIGPHTEAAREEAARNAVASTPTASAEETAADVPQPFKKGDRVVVTNPNGTTVRGRANSDVYSDGGTQRIKVVDAEGNELTPTVDRVAPDKGQVTENTVTAAEEAPTGDRRLKKRIPYAPTWSDRLKFWQTRRVEYIDEEGRVVGYDDERPVTAIAIGAAAILAAIVLAFGIEEVADGDHDAKVVRNQTVLIQKDDQILDNQRTIIKKDNQILANQQRADRRTTYTWNNSLKHFGWLARLIKHSHGHERESLQTLLREMQQDLHTDIDP